MSIIDFKKYLHGRSGVDPRQVEIELNQKKITDINVRLGRVKSYLDAFQNLKRREKDSLKDRKLFPEQLFTGEIREMVALIKGLSDALSSDSYDILQNKFSDFLQSHEAFKYLFNLYISAPISNPENPQLAAEAKLEECIEYRDKTFFIVIIQFLYFLEEFKKKEIQELNDKISNLKNEISLDSEKKAA